MSSCYLFKSCPNQFSLTLCIYCKIPNNSQGVYLFQPLNRPGGNLGQAFNSFLPKIRDENVINVTSSSVNSLASFYKKLLRRRKRFSQPLPAVNPSSLLSLTVAYIYFALIILRDTLVACPFADNSFPHVYLKLLSSLLPPFHQAAWSCCCPPRTDAEAQFLSLSWGRGYLSKYAPAPSV